MDDIRRWLEECDRQRYLDPRGVLVNLEERIDDIPQSLMPLWCGVAGSCYRLVYDYKSAQEILGIGLKAANRTLDHSSAGDIHQRLFTLNLSRADYKKGLEETSRAIVRYLEGAEPIGVAKSFVDRGSAFAMLGESARAATFFEMALAELPESVPRSRAAAFQGAAYILAREGKLQAALTMIRESEAIPTNPFTEAKTQWLNATILSSGGKHEEALDKLFECSDLLLEIAPNSGVLAKVDLVVALLKAGKPVEAHQTAAALTRFISVFTHKNASMALVELANLGLAGQGLTLAILRSARERVSRHLYG